MKKVLKIAGIILAIAIIGGLWFAYTPVDLRPDYLGDKIAEKDYTKGRALLNEMQTAYGGMDNWLSHKTGSYAQVADWYEDKMGIAGWDELPQQFQMTSILGTDFSVFGTNPNVIKLATLELKVNFIKASRSGKFRAVGRIESMGRSIAFLTGDLFDASGQKTASISTTAKIKIKE